MKEVIEERSPFVAKKRVITPENAEEFSEWVVDRFGSKIIDHIATLLQTFCGNLSNQLFADWLRAGLYAQAFYGKELEIKCKTEEKSVGERKILVVCDDKIRIFWENNSVALNLKGVKNVHDIVAEYLSWTGDDYNSMVNAVSHITPAHRDVFRILTFAFLVGALYARENPDKIVAKTFADRDVV